MVPLTVVFVDASIFLHCKPVSDIDWQTLFDAKTVELKIASITSRELNDQKDRGATKQIRERARKALDLLRRFVETKASVQVRPGVSLSIVGRSYSDYDTRGLDPSCNDDKLLLSAMHFAEENPGVSIYIFARDAGFIVKANEYGVNAKLPPEDLELPPAPDEEQKALKKYREQEVALPRLIALFPGRKTFIEHKLPEPPASDPSFVAQCMRKIEKTFPVASPMNPLIGLSHPYTQPHNDHIHGFYKEYHDYLSEWLEYEQQMSRTVPVQLELHNDRGKPAKNIKILLEFPPDVRMLSLPPVKPQRPAKPAPFAKFVPQDGLPIQSDWDDKEDHEDNYHKEPPSGRGLLSVKGHTTELRLEALQHSDSVLLATIYVAFDDYQKIHSFDITGSIVCDELRPAALPNLHVKISAGGVGAIWRIPYLASV